MSLREDCEDDGFLYESKLLSDDLRGGCCQKIPQDPHPDQDSAEALVRRSCEDPAGMAEIVQAVSWEKIL